VDVREVVGSMHLLVHHRAVRSNVAALLSSMYDIFCSEQAPHFAISQQDLLRMCRLPAVSDQVGATEGMVAGRGLADC
jgi:hypothetical protein